MAANAITDFDLGPLTWVKTEIDHSLAQARENLDKLAAAPAERAPVKYILTHLHQATGALAMVGLAAATRFNEELEKLVGFLEGEDAARLPGAVAAAKRGIAALSGYLDTLLAGQADHPMRLLAPYLELNRARGQNDANEGDLFFPNLAIELPGPPAGAPLDDAVLVKALSLQRAQYQQGLLKMLKGADNSEALRQMQAAVAAVESMQAARSNRAFWTAATAFFDAFVFGGLDVSPSAKPLFAKLDQQMKQLMDGSARVAERLFRDLLLAIGRARPVSERITLLKEAYRIEQLLAIPDGVHGDDDEALSGMVRELRDLTAQQKDTWLKYTSGNRAALEPFGKQALALAERAGKLPQNDVQLVLSRLTEVAPALKARAIPPSEAQSLEVATALLFLESALENYFKLGSDFARQARTVTERLKSAMAGEALPPMDAIEGGLLDEMTRRAQEKLLVFQVGQEVQVNLQNIEQVLDAFFRDSGERAGLAALPAQFAQVQGALMIMELMDAAALNAAVMARVQQFAEGSLDGSGESAEMVADGLSALGLYITALQQGAAAPRDVLMPALLRFGLAQQPAPGIESQVRRTSTVSPLDIDVQKQKVAALYEDWKEAPAEGTRERLERAVGDLQRDAAVVSDSAVARQSGEALQLIQDATASDQTGVFRALQGLAPDKAPDDPTPQAVQLVDAPGAEIDKELLDIFLEEAAEVVDTIASSLAAAREAPHDRECLTTIRRGFHTLKGSGRMVGLMQLGEMAWQCEQVMNKWLKEERPASPPLLDFIELARESFARWVGELNENAAARIESAQITQRAEMLKSDGPAAEAPLAIEAPAAPAFEFESLDLTPAPAADSASEAPAEAPALDFAASDDVPVLDFAAPETLPAPTRDAELDFAAVPAPAGESPPDAEAVPELEDIFAEPPSAAATADTTLDFDSLLAAPTPLAGDGSEESSVVIGNVSVPSALFAIFIGEAEQHTAALDREMARIEADAMVPVSADFMRAAHTLASTARTTGFEALADAALALEKWLADAMDLPPEFDAARLGATRRAVDAVTAMVQSIRGNAEPYPRDDTIVELEELREGLRASRRTGEGTHLKMPAVVREALDALDAFNEAVAATPIAAPPAAELPPAAPPVAAPVAAMPVPPLEAPAAPAPVAAIETPAPPEAAAPQAAAMLPAFEAGKEQRKIRDDVDRDLLPVFIDEAREIIPRVSEGVRRWKSAPADHSLVGELQRHLHTLKGSARMTGLMRLGELAHVLETRINAIDEVEAPSVKDFDEIEERVDRFSMSLERLSRGEDILEAEPIVVPVSAVFEHQKDKPAALAMMVAAAQEKSERDALPPELRESRSALLRVNADMIDRFVNDAGELSIARSRIELEMAAFRRALIDLTDNIGRMRTQLREIEIASEGQMQSTIKLKEEHGEQFDPLEFDRFSRMQELTRFLAESLGDVITLHHGLQKNLDETELAIHAQARLNRELQQGLMGVRLVPLGNLADRFYRVVRQTAKELEKKANLEIKGTRTELDRSVLEKITGPFEHLLRNAISHGIELPAERVRAGKPEIGEISIDAAQRGNEVVLTIADDGAGLDFARIRQKAVEANLLAPDVELPEAQLAQFIFAPGFSTAAEVSEISGRGVGMDVVKSEITSLGGRVDIASSAGRGATFTITLPLTLAVTQAVMLRAGTTVYAVPTVMVDQVQELKAAGYSELAAQGEVVWKDNRYPLRSLLPLLGEIDTPTPARQIPVLLLKSGVQRAAIRVDEIIGNREVVVKTIGPQLARLAGIAGATVLGNGQVVLILNPVQLVHREQPSTEVPRTTPTPQEAPLVVEEKSGAPLVMVVDDSLTVRKITSRMLAREGFEVATAKDGVDALQQLQDIRPQCILLDVEMPRMDGFEFARNVRADESTRRIPIIMITSRTADKHRNHALEIGVNEYMGKPYQEDQLLALIRRYTQESVLA
jgi:chemosensory pili system protein ChpA (sensor histidine kinase/response regulator)